MLPLLYGWEWDQGPAALSKRVRHILFMLDSALCLPGMAVAVGPIALLQYLVPHLDRVQLQRLAGGLALLGGAAVWGFTWWMIRTGVGKARWRRVTVILAWILWLGQLFLAGLQSNVYRD